MKSMKKGLSMNKMFGSIKRRPTNGGPSDSVSNDGASDPQGDSPEAVAARSVRAFCESGGPNNISQGDEVTFLPPIVESAESSPAAAAECARIIRKYLKRDYWSKPSMQYNALMLLRILSDNPGQTFTRNMDAKFVETAKELLKSGRDLSVKQMLMETLDSFERTKSWDEGLGMIIEMWKKEKAKAYKAYGGQGAPPPPIPRNVNAPPAIDPHSQNYFARSHNNKRLPDTVELATRLEEARTSAKLLTQVVACTPPAEVLDNDLIKEFADRCLSASRSIQGYMTAQDPSPDNETMESLIDTNEQLQQALNQHQRAVLSSRKTLGIGDRSQNPSPTPPSINGSSRPPLPHAQSTGSYSGTPPPLPGQRPIGNGKGKGKETATLDVPPPPGPPPGHPAAAGPSRSANATPRTVEEQDPFRDPVPDSYGRAGNGSGSSRAPAIDDEPRLAFEPFHPGFNNSTKSYLGRQDSAMNKVQMHGAGSTPHDDDEKEVVPDHRAGGGSGSSRPMGRQPQVSDDDLYNNKDEYSSSSKGKAKQPIYRY